LSIQLHSRPLIIHVINDLSAGGAELLLINTIKILPDYEHIVVYLFAGKDLAENFNDQNVDLICLHHKGWRSIFSSTRKLKEIIKKENQLWFILIYLKAPFSSVGGAGIGSISIHIAQPL
jgi:hypothetical protein